MAPADIGQLYADVRISRPSGGKIALQSDVFFFCGPISIDGLKGVSLLDIAVGTFGQRYCQRVWSC